VYRRTEEPKIGLRDPQKKEKEEQFERVEASRQPSSRRCCASIWMTFYIGPAAFPSRR
jgi:hypothetical protein